MKGLKSNDYREHSQEKDKTYFNYYGMLMHQQNMLLDSIRTALYYQAITTNPNDFAGKIVLDIGAGTGILSFFAAKMAAKVYAVEASNMATHARSLAQGNGLSSIVQVVHGKIEEIELPTKVDVIISEPMGVMLVHERMMESLIIGRDKFLKPNSRGEYLPNQMYPSSGKIYLSPFTDMTLYSDTLSKASFWNNRDFHGVDLTHLLEDAMKSQFAQVIVGPIDPRTLLSEPIFHLFNFFTMNVDEFREFVLPFNFNMEYTGIVHGMAGWFDVNFDGSANTFVLSTSPNCDTTHWYQARFVFRQPIAVNRGQVLSGQMRFIANEERSMDISISVKLEGSIVNFTQNFALQEQQYWNLSGITTANFGKDVLGLYS